MSKRKIKFRCPSTVESADTIAIMKSIVAQIEEDRDLTAADIPHLHRMATSYDLYLKANDALALQGPIMVNSKGEEVKHPYVNIARENWNEFLRVSREFGITPKSKSQMGAHKPVEQKTDDPIDEFFKGK